MTLMQPLETPGGVPEAGSFADDWRRLAACLGTVLRALGWSGDSRDILEVLSPQPGGDIVLELRNAAARLGFSCRVMQRAAFTTEDLDRLGRAADGERTPLMLVGPKREAYLLQHGREGWSAAPIAAGGALLAFARGEATTATGESWFYRQARESLPLAVRALLLTLFANLMALASPLFVMAVYDQVIAADSPSMLVYLAIGAVGAAVFEFLFRRMRARVMVHASLRLGYVVGNAVFGRLLGLPFQLTERVGLSSQLSRVRDIDRVRELFSGMLGQAALDLPFTAMFFVVIAILGQWLVLAPIVATLLFAVLAIAGNAALRRRTAAVAQANAQRQVVALEMVERMAAIRASGSAGYWLRRFKGLATRAAAAAEGHAQTAFVVATAAQALTTLAALSVLIFGVSEVFAGTLTTGGLIACMMMTWRLLGPVQNACNASTRLGQMGASVKQIDSLIATPPEPTNLQPDADAPIAGRIAFNRVTFRYGRETDPILANVSFQAEPGEILAVLGGNGGGKSTILKLASGLYQAQGGNVRIDDRDIRQYDPLRLRRSIAYVPQVPQFFQGTLLDNLRMAAPEADGIAILDALDKAGALDAVTMLKDGLQTPFDSRAVPLPGGLLARLALARAYLRDAPIVLLDEPATGFDFEGEFAFVNALEHLRSRNATVILVTHRRRYIGIADKVLILDKGGVRYFGSAEKVKDRVPKGMM